jgi:hypothetical protein
VDEDQALPIRHERPQGRYAVCIRNEEYEGALELRKIYEVLEDPKATGMQYVGIIDESGEDYLYPAAWFLPLDLPRAVETVLAEFVSK